MTSAMPRCAPLRRVDFKFIIDYPWAKQNQTAVIDEINAFFVKAKGKLLTIRKVWSTVDGWSKMEELFWEEEISSSLEIATNEG